MIVQENVIKNKDQLLNWNYDKQNSKVKRKAYQFLNGLQVKNVKYFNFRTS